MLLAAVALVIGVSRGQLKLGLEAPSIEERLARYPASAGAVIIKAQRRRALKRMLPAALLAAPLVVAVQFLPAHTLGAFLCEHLGPAEAVQLILRMFFPGLPVVLAIAALLAVVRALRVLRGGYLPPLDAVVMQDTIAVTGWRAKLHAWLVITVMPVMVAVLFYVTHAFVQTFDSDANRQALASMRCSKAFQK